jgi:hypothetical protein
MNKVKEGCVFFQRVEGGIPLCEKKQAACDCWNCNDFTPEPPAETRVHPIIDEALTPFKPKEGKVEDKPCEYCALCNVIPASDKLDGLTALQNKKLLPFVSVKLVSEGIQIKGLTPNFCPMCGRKLDSKEA